MEAQQTLIFVHYTALALFALVLSLGFSAFSPMEGRAKRAYLVVALGVLAFMTMFRASTVGNDTQEYILAYLSVARTPDIAAYIASSVIEPAYLLWNWLISRFTSDPQALFVLTGTVVYLSIGRFLYKWVPAPGLVVFALVTMHLFGTYLFTMRQTMAQAVLLFAFDFAYERKPVRFALLCVAAMQFHMAVLFFLLVYPVVNSKTGDGDAGARQVRLLLLAGGVVAIMVCFDGVLGVLMRLFPKYQYYLGGRTVDGKTRLATVLNIAVYSLMFFVPKLFNPAKSVVAAREETAFRRLSALNILTFIVSTNATILTRFTGLFTLFSVGEFSTSVSRLPRRERVVTVLLSVARLYAYGLVIAILRTPEWYTTYPFAFCWM